MSKFKMAAKNWSLHGKQLISVKNIQYTSEKNKVNLDDIHLNSSFQFSAGKNDFWSYIKDRMLKSGDFFMKKLNIFLFLL